MLREGGSLNNRPANPIVRRPEWRGTDSLLRIISTQEAHDNSDRVIMLNMQRELLIVLALASTALAQSSAPTTRPAINAPTTRSAQQRSAEEMLRQMLQPANQGAQPLKPIPDVQPQVDATSGTGAVAPSAPTQRLEHEGTLLLDR